VWRPHSFLPRKFSVLESKFRLALSSQKNGIVLPGAITILNAVEVIAMMVADADGIVERVDYV
jgi:hypothetical protein